MARSRPAVLLRVVLFGLLLFALLLSFPARLTLTGDVAEAAAGRGVLAQSQSPPPALPGRASLRLTWADSAPHAGVPTGLVLQALDAAGNPDPGRAGTALLTVDDPRADVSLAATGQTLAGAPVSAARPAQRVAVPLAGGTATVTAAFAAPGPHLATAVLADAPDVAGQSAVVPVQATFLAIQPPVSVGQAAKGRFTLVAQDDQGRPVASYARRVVLATDDPDAVVQDLAGDPAAPVAGAPGKAAAGHAFVPGAGGRAQLDLTFARPGAHTVEVRDAADGTRLAALPVSVAAAALTAGATAEPSTALAPAATLDGRRADGPAADVEAPVVAARAAGVPSFQVTLSATTVTAGTALTMTVTALDANGTVWTGYTGTVRLSSTDPAFLPGTAFRYTFTGASGHPPDTGVHQFSVTFVTPGAAQTLGVVDTANPAMTGLSPAVNVTAASGARFGVAMSAGTVAAGTGLTMTVTALNPDGTTNPAYAGTVQLTSTDPAFLPGTAFRYTFSARDGGAHAFTVTFNSPGTQTITVRDAATPTTIGTSPAVSVTTGGGGAFTVTMSTTATNAGVTIQMTVTPGTAGYAGTLQFTATDPAFAPGPLFSYAFGRGETAHVFDVTFATAGPQTVTVFDAATPSSRGTSPAVTVAETALAGTFAAGSPQQGTATSLTVQAKDAASGTVLTGFRGTVRLAASFGSVRTTTWGAGVDTSAVAYTFTAADAGSHTLTPVFDYAGDQTVTVTDAARAARTVTTAPVTVTNTPAAMYAHEAAPAGAQLADGSVVWAYLGVRGRLYVRRNAGTLAEPAWRPAVLVRDTTAAGVGADSPSLALFGNTLALFHTYTDGTYLQVWLTTSTDNGATWTAPTQLTTEAGHVQRLQAVVSGGTLSLFWSRQDTNGRLFSQTTTTLTTWSAKATVGQAVGPAARNTTSNFAVTRLAAGSWLLGWLGGSAAGEPPLVAAGDLDYPTVRVATSPDLATWSAATELSAPYGSRWPRSVALAQDGGGTIRALFERYVPRLDSYLVQRTSTTGTAWTAATVVGYDRAGAADGTQGYTGALPGFAAGTTQCAYSVEVGGGTLQAYGHADVAEPTAGKAVAPLDCAAPAEVPLLPYGDMPQTALGPGVSPVSGLSSASGADLAVAARGFPLAVGRTYTSFDAVAGHSGPFGFGWTWTYGTRAVTHADGSVSVVEASGARSVFWKNGASWTAAPGINGTLAAAGGGGYALTRHDQTVWSFGAAGQLTSVADRNGNTLTLTYVGGQLTTVASGGRALSVTWTGGRITRIDGPASAAGPLAATYTYDAAGNLAAVTDAAGAVRTYTYSADGRHQLVGSSDERGYPVVSTTYGTQGRVVGQNLGAVIDPRTGLPTGGWLATVGYAYPAEGYAGGWGGTDAGATVLTDPRGTPVKSWHDAGLRLTQRETWDTLRGAAVLLQRVQWASNANNDVISTTDGNGRVHTATYDGRGNRLSFTVDSGPGGLNLTSTWTYSPANDPLTATDPRGITTAYGYDPRGNRTSTTVDAGAGHLNLTTTSVVDQYGQVTQVTDATGRVTNYAYDPATGDLTGTTVAPGTAEAATTTFAYDGAGRRTTVTDPLGHQTTVTSDRMGRVLTQTVDPGTGHLNLTTTFAYDPAGNRTRVTDPASHATGYSYDSLNRVTTVTDALGGVTTYGYDASGNRTSTTDANNHTWSSAYDALGRRTTETDPLAHTVAAAYDANGNRIQVTRADGVVNRSVYDPAGRLTGIDLGNDGTLDLQYAYDPAGRRTAMTDGDPRSPTTTTYGYDDAGRLRTTAVPATGTVTYGFDPAGRLTSLTYPATGHVVSYAYSGRGQLQTVTDWRSPAGVTTYSYDLAGRRTQTTPPPAPTVPPSTYSYDAANRLTRIVHGYIDGPRGPATLGLGYTYDPAGNRTAETDLAGGPATATYGYDALNRLTSATYANGDVVGYGYDAVGNRTSLTVNGSALGSSYDVANRLTTAGGVTFGYDPNGNQTSQTAGGVTTTYGYDPLDRLVSFTSGGSTWTYTYNGDGLRVAKTVGGVTTRSAWATLFGLPQVLSDGATESVWSQELISELPISGGARHAQADALGSTRQETDATGTAVGARQYDAFGAPRAQTGTQPGFGFTGAQADAESGLVYLRARYYDPASGRFLTKDPAPGCGATPQRQHAYAYVANNPLRYADPTGRELEAPEVTVSPPGNPDFKRPTPVVKIQQALDDGVCSVAESGGCLETIWERGLLGTYVPNHKDFEFGRNLPFGWWPNKCTICKAIIRTYISGSVAGAAYLLCGAIGLSTGPGGFACAIVAGIIVDRLPPTSQVSENDCIAAGFCKG